jgi:hypothetical protein
MALADGADPDHVRAKSFRDAWLRRGGRFVSTDFIVDEVTSSRRASKSFSNGSESRRFDRARG